MLHYRKGPQFSLKSTQLRWSEYQGMKGMKPCYKKRINHAQKNLDTTYQLLLNLNNHQENLFASISVCSDYKDILK